MKFISMLYMILTLTFKLIQKVKIDVYTYVNSPIIY